MRRLLAPLLGVVLLVGSAATVSADSEVAIDPLLCAVVSNGAMAVEPGDTVIATFGWGAKTLGQEKAFLNSAHVALSIDGQPTDVKPYLGEPSQVDKKFWTVFWNVPVGTLAAGESVTITLDIVLDQPVYDGFGHSPRGSIFGGPITCVLTAVPS